MPHDGTRLVMKYLDKKLNHRVGSHVNFVRDNVRFFIFRCSLCKQLEDRIRILTNY